MWDVLPLADKYRNPVMMIGDGMIGQMMEPVEFPEEVKEPPLPPKDWAATGAKGRKPVVIKSLFLDPQLLEDNSWMLHAKYEQMKKEEIRFERYKIATENKVLLIAYGTMARICQTAIDELEREGISVGLFRPISLFPFPEKQVYDEIIKKNVADVLVIEMSTAQMCEDIERVARGKKTINFYGRTGGIVPSPEEVMDQIKKLVDKRKPKSKKKKA